MKDVFVSVVLPCFNESGNIIPLIDAIHQELSFCRHEIIVVDDNSPDGTYKLVQSKNYEFVKAILRTKDPSLAKSIREGIENASGNAIVIMDSDFNHQPKYIPVLVKNLEFYDCVMGSRFVYGGGMESRFRHIFSWLFNIFVRVCTRTMVTESLYGYLSVRADALKSINFDKVFWGYGDYCIRLNYYLQKQNKSILQVPTMNGARLTGQSKSRFLKMLWQYTLETFRLAFFRK